MIKIYTAVVNRPEFIELQAKTFKKFIKNKFEFTVLDDSIDRAMTQRISEACKKAKVNYIKIPPEVHNVSRQGVFIGSYACAAGLQWAYNTLFRGTKNEVMWLDSDMFLYEPLDIKKYLSDCSLSGLPQQRDHIKYFWNGLLFFNMKSLPDAEIDFFPQPVDQIPTDVGGPLYYFFNEHEKTLLKPIKHTSHLERDTVSHLPKWSPEGYDYAFKMEILMDKFLHYGSGTNWPFNPTNESYLTTAGSAFDPTELKTAYLQDFIKAAVARKNLKANTEWVDPTITAKEFVQLP
jgi:hypothetical protein